MRLRDKKGFTLMELIIVMAILVILSGLTIPMVGQYLTRSRMIQYNDYAKSIFLSAQSYLMNAKNAGQLEEVASKTTPVPKDQVAPGYYGGEDTGYLMVSKGSPQGAELQNLLRDYIYDPGILRQSICLEYNVRTGMVYSVSYSESASGFFYGLGQEQIERNVSISDRSRAKREHLRFGYYSAPLLDAPADAQRLEDSSIQLINEDQLYCVWSDAEPAGATVSGGISYTIKLYDAQGTGLPLQSVTIPAGGFQVQNNVNGLRNFLVSAPTTYYDEQGNAINQTPQNANYWVYLKIEEGNKKSYTMVLDTVDTTANGGGSAERSIVTSFPSVGARRIQASVQATSLYYAPNGEALSNIEHSLFASESSGTAQIKNVRHLYNTRYASAATNFVQQADLDWRKALDDKLIVYDNEFVQAAQVFDGGTVKPGNLSYAFPAIAYNTTTRATVTPYTGRYDGNNKQIQNLYITGNYQLGRAYGPTGLFASNDGAIQDLTLSGLTVYGAEDLVGAVAGENLAHGSIQNLSVSLNKLLAPKGSVGGIAGGNSGMVMKCKVDLLELRAAEDHVGGIVGVNAGTIGEGCATNTTLPNKAQGNIYGRSNVGGIVGLNKDSGTVADGVQMLGGSVNGSTGPGLAATDGNNIGGIIGQNTSNSTTFSKFMNKAAVHGNKYVGGIIGVNLNGTLSNCQNEGFVQAQTAYAGGIAGANGEAEQDTGARIYQCTSNVTVTVSEDELLKTAGDFVGGIAGYNNGAIQGSIGSISTSNCLVIGNNFVGGIAGHNDSRGVVEYCAVSGGRIIAKGDFAGGFFGLNTVRDTGSMPGTSGMEMKSNPELVQGRMYVGGAIGGNLVAATGGTSELSLSIVTGSSEGGGKSGKVQAVEFAGGILGYNGVIDGSGDPDQALDQALEALLTRSPYSPPPSTTESSTRVTTLTGCNNWMAVTADTYVGGIIGYNSAQSKLQVLKSNNNGALSVNTAYNQSRDNPDMSYYIGGITGRNSKTGLIDTCNNNGAIDSLSKYTGGIAEVNEGRVVNCTNVSVVRSNKSHVGGIVGLNGGTDIFDAVVDTCTAQNSQISGLSHLGGVVGENMAQVLNCNAFNTVVSVQKNGPDESFVGGIIGLNGPNARIQKNKVDDKVVVTGVEYVGGIVGVSDSGASMERMTNYATVTGRNYVGGIVGKIRADSGSVIQIENCINLGTVRAVNTSGSASERAEVGGITGINPEGGKILNCINGQKGNATLGVVEGWGTYTGGIVSYNDGEMTNCESFGTVRGARSAGGIAGLNEENGLIVNSEETSELGGKIYSTSSSGSQLAMLGGLVADNQSKETKNRTLEGYEFSGLLKFEKPSYARVEGNKPEGQFAGGIVGRNDSGYTIEACDFTGTIEGGNAGSGGITGLNYGTVQNITVGKEKASVSSTGRSGGIIGYAMASTVQSNLHNDSKLTVKGTQSVGGLFGTYVIDTENSFTGETNRATVIGNAYTGGLFGEVITNNFWDPPKLTLTKCENSGSVQGWNVTASGYKQVYEGIGGLIGFVQVQATFDSCVNTSKGKVEGQSSSGIGGLAGTVYADGGAPATFTNCKNQGSITAGTTSNPTGNSVIGMGGLVGNMMGALVMENCTNEGNVATEISAAHATGGLIGNAASRTSRDTMRIENCTNIAAASVRGVNNVGGIVGAINQSNVVQTFKFQVLGCKNLSSSTEGKGSYIGGIVGYARATTEKSVSIENCVLGSAGNTAEDVAINKSVLVRATGANSVGVGGIVGGSVIDGTNRTVTLELHACKLYGNVTTTGAKSTRIGGIIGSVADVNAILADCSAEESAVVTGAGSQVGGIAGYLSSSGTGGTITVKNCSNRATVGTGGGIAGGILGEGRPAQNTTIQVEQSHNYGKVWNLNNVITTKVIGGIAGKMSGGSVILTQCDNGTPTDNTAVVTAGSYVGGIVGSASGTGKVENCNNYAPVTSQSEKDGAYAGGIAGEVGGSAILTSVSNRGPVESKSQTIGGIAGIYTGGKISNAVNLATVTATKGKSGSAEGVGGIVGRLQGTVTLEKCLNNAPVVAGQAGGVGGVVGYASGKATVTECYNLETVTGAGGCVGGIVGWARNFGGTDLTFLSDINFGTVISTAKLSGTCGMGGIVGKLEFAVAKQCYNFGTVETAAGVDGVAVGGIAGDLYLNKARIERCINAGSVKAPQATSVGGVCGINAGAVVSSQNMEVDLQAIPAGLTSLAAAYQAANTLAGEMQTLTGVNITIPTSTGTPEVVGDLQVGGIVGYSVATSGKQTGLIYSEKSSIEQWDDYVLNSMQVTSKRGNLGGIAGEVHGGDILNAYNTGSLISESGTKSVGGAVGVVKTHSQSAGGVAGVFNLGDVDSTNGQPNRGGSVGFRDPAEKDLFAIIDSYFNSIDVPETTVNSLQGRWRVGNEPDFRGGVNDGPLHTPIPPNPAQVVSDLGSPDFLAAYQSVVGAGAALPADQEELVRTFLRKYVYRLNPPNHITVTNDPDFGNSYSIGWQAPAGVVGGYEIQYNIYEPDKTTPLATETQTGIKPNDDRVAGKPFDPQYIGCYFQVQMKSLGAEKDGEQISSDSGLSDPGDQFYLILPPMLKPDVQLADVVQTGETSFDFTISNKADYSLQGKPIQDYGAKLQALHDTGAYGNAYTDYINQFDRITMTVVENNQQVVTFGPDFKANYTFLMNGAKEKTFTLRFIAYPKKATPQAYCVSQEFTLMMTVKVAEQLDPPVLEIKFNNAAQADEMKYDLQFHGPAKATAYVMKITDADGNVVCDYTDAPSPLPGGSAQQTLPLMPTPFTFEQGKTYTVSMISKGDDGLLLDSEPAEVTFTVPKQLSKPTVSIEREPDTDQYTIKWNGLPGEVNDGYTVKITQVDRGDPTNRKELFNQENTADTSFKVDYTYAPGNPDSLIENGYDLEVEVVQRGKVGDSFDSDPFTNAAPETPFLIPARLQLTGKIESASVTGTNDYTFTWGAATPGGDCTEYVFYALLLPVEGDPFEIGRVAGTEANPTLNHLFDVKYAQKSLTIYVVALGKDGISSNSIPLTGDTLTLLNVVAPPVDLTLETPAPADEMPSVDFATFEPKVTWTYDTATAGLLAPKAYKWELLDPDGTALKSVEMTDPAEVTAIPVTTGDGLGKFDPDFLPYLGKTLKVRVQAYPESMNVAPSAWIEMELPIPKIRLVQPEPTINRVDPDDSTNPDYQMFEWPGDPYAADQTDPDAKAHYELTAYDDGNNSTPLIPVKQADGSWNCTIPPDTKTLTLRTIGKEDDGYLTSKKVAVDVASGDKEVVEDPPVSMLPIPPEETIPPEGGEPTPPVPGEGGEPTPPVPGEGGEPTPPVPGEGGEPTPPASGEGGEPTPPASGEGGEPIPPAPPESGEPTPPASGDSGEPDLSEPPDTDSAPSPPSNEGSNGGDSPAIENASSADNVQTIRALFWFVGKAHQNFWAQLRLLRIIP